MLVVEVNHRSKIKDLECALMLKHKKKTRTIGKCTVFAFEK